MKPKKGISTQFYFHPAKLKAGLFLVLAVLFFSLSASAQKQGVRNLPKSDHQKMHFGFILGLNVSDFDVKLVPDFRIIDSIYTLESESVTGLNLGILANYSINDYFDLRFVPSLSFAQRNLNYYFIYSDSSQGRVVKNVESNYLQFPIDLKIKSKRLTNYRVYAFGGFMYSIDMISQAAVEAKDKEIVKLTRFDYGYEIGMGFDFYMTYFKFSPEIKMYHGLNNMLSQDGKTYSKPIEALYSKVFTISFVFSD